MDCRNFKEMLDSYFCQELAVETNHAMLGHAEHCPPCRNEMASRRNLREALQRACAQDQMSDEACQRLRARLRAEAGGMRNAKTTPAADWREGWARLFNLRTVFPAAMAAAALILGALGIGTYLWRADRAEAVQLSASLMTEAAEDHRKCTSEVTEDSQAYGIPSSVAEFDAACLGLEKIAEEGAQGLQLCAAHVCTDQGRRFAHLIYRRDGELVSLLVTSRDAQAMKAGRVVALDAQPAQLPEAQQTELSELALDAYQTSQRVVLVISPLSKIENEKLARTLAAPVVAHLRRVESQTAFVNWPEFELPFVVTTLVVTTRND